MIQRVSRQTKQLERTTAGTMNCEQLPMTPRLIKSSEVGTILEKRLQKQTMTTMNGSVNHLIELGMATLATTSIQNDEYIFERHSSFCFWSKAGNLKVIS